MTETVTQRNSVLAVLRAKTISFEAGLGGWGASMVSRIQPELGSCGNSIRKFAATFCA
jgi:hypothetical protein